MKLSIAPNACVARSRYRRVAARLGSFAIAQNAVPNTLGIGPFFDYPAPGSRIASELSKTPIKEGFLGGQKRDRAPPNWRIVAGPKLTASQLHCATVPDGPDRKWTEGKLERIETQNRAALREHFDKLAAKERAEIEANGEFTEPEWREAISPDDVRCFVTPFRDAPAADATDLIATIPDDLSIPAFSKRSA